MRAKEIIQSLRSHNLVERHRGLYADLTRGAENATYYVKCPVCGNVHGNYKDTVEAHTKRLCPACNLDAINKIKDEVQKVVSDPAHKPKEMAKIVGNSPSKARK